MGIIDCIIVISQHSIFQLSMKWLSNSNPLVLSLIAKELHEMGGNSIALRAAMVVICTTLCATDPHKMGRHVNRA